MSEEQKAPEQSKSSQFEAGHSIPATTLEALSTLTALSSSEGLSTLTNCDKLSASLEQIRVSKNLKLFEKLDQIRQDFSGLNNKLAQMEESISNLNEVTNNLVKSLPRGAGNT